MNENAVIWIVIAGLAFWLTRPAAATRIYGITDETPNETSTPDELNNSVVTNQEGTFRMIRPQGTPDITGAFDAELRRHRDADLKVPLFPMERLAEIISKHRVKMAIVSVPAAAGQAVINELTALGIVGILNFAPVVPVVPDHVTVNNVNLAIELENLSYFIQE